MAIQLFLNLNGLKYYGNIPEKPENSSGMIEEYALSSDDIKLFIKDIDSLDVACNALLDLGDVDYFNAEKCRKLIEWIRERFKQPVSARYREILETLMGYCERAIELNTGVVIEL